MNRYTIYCTETQTKKALELGAPIETRFDYDDGNLRPFPKEVSIEFRKYAEIPIAEQMIGWLEEQKIFVHISPCVDISCSWHISSKGYNKYGYTSDIKVCKTREEATLAAIDAALVYLSKNKK